MCEPATLTLIATGVAAAGTAVSGIMTAQQQRYQAKVADANAKISSQQAADALQRGKLEEQKSYRRTAQIAGSQRAAMAANGIETDFGSAMRLQGDTAMIGAEEAANVRANAERESQGYDMEAGNYRSSAKASRMAATGTLVKTAFDTSSTILGGAQQYRKIQAGRSGAASFG